MKLIIVESPTKAKTITKFLDSNYKVESCFGHIRDLPKSEIGIDIENNFQPKYIVPDKAKITINHLKSLAKKADHIILATDEDREGEAIAWHLEQILESNSDLKNRSLITNHKSSVINHQSKISRIVFHEITKNAILRALKNFRKINIHLVNAQQARRVLDRLVGYELSPFLWKKVARGLSAGRVQSVAVRLIVEREREIQAFKQEEYWSIEAKLAKIHDNKSKIKSFRAQLNKINGKTINKLEIKNKKQADKILDELKNAEYIINNIQKKQNKKNPPKPFTTSTLQQTANRWFGFSAKQTMMLAQRLYEQGFITYMRTDSLNLSNQFLEDAYNYLLNNLGKEYCLQNPRIFKIKSKSAQEAHEAIRPTDVNHAPELIQDSQQRKIYKLIWQRLIACQMPEAIVDATTVNINASQKYQFRATGQILKFDGYLKIYPEKSLEIELPELKNQEKLDCKNIKANQHFTKPPARYSDAGLIKDMEKYGIGRPSTYAPTITTIESRNYVKRDNNKKLYPTEIAFITNDLLIKHFTNIVDYKFTALMENNLDNIAHGKIKWQSVVRDFYNPFHQNLEIKNKTLNKTEIMPEEKSNEKCDKCGVEMIIKIGRYGKFLACSAYPNCKNLKDLKDKNQIFNTKENKKNKELEKKYQNEKCNKCGSRMILRNGKFGPFLGCSNYPRCKIIKNIRENNNSTGISCPVCNKGEIVQKRSKRGIFYACDQYPDCKTAFWDKPTGKKCLQCKALLIKNKGGEIKCSNKKCNQ